MTSAPLSSHASVGRDRRGLVLIHEFDADGRLDRLTEAPLTVGRPEGQLELAFERVGALRELGASLQRARRARQPIVAVYVCGQAAPPPVVMTHVGRLLAEWSGVALLLEVSIQASGWGRFLNELGGSGDLVLVEPGTSPAVLRQWLRALGARAQRASAAPLAGPAHGEPAANAALEGASLDRQLEAVGRLAAGLAHEINTPVQFVSDSLYFLEDTSAELCAALESLLEQARRHPQAPLACELIAHAEQLDLGFLLEQTPSAFERIHDGLDRVTRLVAAMREFAPREGAEDPLRADINRAIENTLEVARNEYKYVATVDLELGELPLVECHIHDINQVLLNLVVNAAHAIEERHHGREERGRIRIQTRRAGERVCVEIADDGCGIEAHVLDRIFDPFFTTKPVGTGTGQGLALVQGIIERKHLGQVTVESAPGQGATFRVYLPIEHRRSGLEEGTP